MRAVVKGENEQISSPTIFRIQNAIISLTETSKPFCCQIFSMNETKNSSDLKQSLQRLYAEIKQRYGIAKLGIFGSYVRNEQREDSDLDVLIAFDEPPSLFEYIELENLISDTLGVKVDLVMEDALKPNLKERILHEVQMI